MATDAAYQQDTGASVQAAGVIKKTKVEIDGHVGELEKTMVSLSDAWRSNASTEHDDLMRRWRESVTRLAGLMEKVSIDLAEGTQTLAQAAGGLTTSGSVATPASSSTQDRIVGGLSP